MGILKPAVFNLSDTCRGRLPDKLKADIIPAERFEPRDCHIAVRNAGQYEVSLIDRVTPITEYRQRPHSFGILRMLDLSRLTDHTGR
jgi:hypothetical protein